MRAFRHVLGDPRARRLGHLAGHLVLRSPYDIGAPNPGEVVFPIAAVWPQEPDSASGGDHRCRGDCGAEKTSARTPAAEMLSEPGDRIGGSRFPPDRESVGVWCGNHEGTLGVDDASVRGSIPYINCRYSTVADEHESVGVLAHITLENPSESCRRAGRSAPSEPRDGTGAGR